MVLLGEEGSLDNGDSTLSIFTVNIYSITIITKYSVI